MIEKLSLSTPIFRRRLWLAAASLILLSAAQASPWSKVKAPAPGPANVIGGAANGCLGGAAVLPAQGTGFVSIRRHRNRYYGHPELLALIEDLGRALGRRGGEAMMVGDLSQPRGGLMSTSHRSHQNGLDVDIWFRLVPSATSVNGDYPEGADPASMVAPGGLGVAAAWGEPQRFLLKTTAEDPRIDRLFVNPAIKRALCETERGDRSWLRKVRPWWGHDAHFHARIQCPPGSPSCDRPSPLPAGDGCGKDLAWWFSEEARKPSKQQGPRSQPIMPEACRALLPSS